MMRLRLGRFVASCARLASLRTNSWPRCDSPTSKRRPPALFAAFLLIGFQEYFRELEAWRLVMYGALLIGVILFAPKGLAGLKKYVW